MTYCFLHKVPSKHGSNMSKDYDCQKSKNNLWNVEKYTFTSFTFVSITWRHCKFNLFPWAIFLLFPWFRAGDLIFISYKAVLEPRVSPAFAITYFCNHCNITFDPIPAKNWNQRSLTLYDLKPQVCWSHMCDSTQGSLYPSPMKIHKCTSMWIQWPFFKQLNQRSLTPRWPLTPYLLRSHVWLYSRIIVSKSHGNIYVSTTYIGNVCGGYSDQFCKKYHILHTYTHKYTYIHTYTTYRMSDHIVSFWTQFRQDKKSAWLTLWCTCGWLLLINLHTGAVH